MWAERELKFQQVAAQLRRGIRDGTWAPGVKLPTEVELAATAGVSVNTARRAFEELVAEGRVERRRGAGSFVTATADSPVRRGQGPRRRIGVLLPEAELYFAPMVRGIEAASRARRCSLAMRSTGYESDAQVMRALDELLAAEVQGLLLTPAAPEVVPGGALARRLEALPIPAVYLERRWAGAGAADRTEHVYTDHAGGAYDAVAHLHRLGHREMALVRRLGATPTAGVERGFAQAVQAFGLRLRAGIDWQPMATEMSCGRAEESSFARSVLRGLCEAGVTAVLCFGDFEASLLLEAARRAGVGVPGKLALVSYDDSTAAEAEVPLTAVAPEKFRMGRMAVEILTHRLDDAEAELRQVRLRPRLIIRSSCGMGVVDSVLPNTS